MKLYYAPGACSLSPHIVAREAGIPIQLQKVNTKDKSMEGGGDFWQVNPRGYVPVLELDNGERLTEGPAIVQYLADQKPDSGLAPKPGSLERYRLQEWLNYIATELHKGYAGMARKPPEERQALLESISQKFGYVAGRLASGPFLVGERFTVADAYLFTVLTWSPARGVDLAQWPALKAYYDRIAARPAVKEALRAEGG